MNLGGMKGWEIAFSPGNFVCEARFDDFVCGAVVPAGYFLGRHADYSEWACLSCAITTVRQVLRAQRVGAASATNSP